jgi:hypothetical protein
MAPRSAAQPARARAIGGTGRGASPGALPCARAMGMQAGPPARHTGGTRPPPALHPPSLPAHPALPLPPPVPSRHAVNPRGHPAATRPRWPTAGPPPQTASYPAGPVGARHSAMLPPCCCAHHNGCCWACRHVRSNLQALMCRSSEWEAAISCESTKPPRCVQTPGPLLHWLHDNLPLVLNKLAVAG